MTYIILDGVQSYYEKTGDGKQSIILLHGWGQNTIMMKPIADFFEQKFTIYNIDFLGFGKSSEPNRSFTPDDYCEWLRSFTIELNIENPILIGHSFGGHIAMRYAAKYEVRKLILTGAAGLKPKRGLDYYFKVYSYKLGKKIPIINKIKLNKNAGSTDYQNTKGIMRETFVKVVNSYVNDLILNIKCPTLLIYGSDDDATPLWMGKYLERNIKDAGLVVFEKRSHYAYYEEINRFNMIVDAFIKGDA